MPWCEECAKYWAPSAMTDGGECPSCGRLVEALTPPKLTAKTVNVRELAGDDAKAPWHFKLLMVLLVAYLGWRIIAPFV